MSKLVNARLWRTARWRTASPIIYTVIVENASTTANSEFCMNSGRARGRHLKRCLFFSAVLNAGWSSDGNGPVLKLCKGRIHPFNKVIKKIFRAFGSLTRRLKKDTGTRAETTVFRERLFSW